MTRVPDDYAAGVLNTRAWACVRRAELFVELHVAGRISRLDLALLAVNRADNCLGAIVRLGYENDAMEQRIRKLLADVKRLQKESA